LEGKDEKSLVHAFQPCHENFRNFKMGIAMNFFFRIVDMLLRVETRHITTLVQKRETSSLMQTSEADGDFFVCWNMQ